MVWISHDGCYYYRHFIEESSIKMKITSRKKISLLLALFLMPLVAAMVLYFYAPHWMLYKTINQGKLISSFKIQELIEHESSHEQYSDPILDRKWHLIYITPHSCDEN